MTEPSTDLTERLRAWTYRRLRLGDPAATAEEALLAVVAVYSAHPTAPLALGVRAPAMTGDEFRALEQDRRALRIPGMRGSLFLAPLQAAPRIFAPFRITTAKVMTRMRRARMTDEECTLASQRVVAAATRPLLPRELHEAAGVAGTEMSMLLRIIRGEGDLLAVNDRTLRVATLRYVATDRWAPGSLAGADPDSALEQLAHDYLRAYGPARVADFAWWTGTSRGVAGRALAANDTVDIGGGLLLLRADEAAFSSVAPLRGAVALLPKWDPYTMGYAPDGRARLVHPDNQPRIYVQKGVVAPGQPNVGLPGDGYPVVLVDGEAVGTWSLTLKGGSVELFDSAGTATRKRIDERLTAASALLAS